MTGLIGLVLIVFGVRSLVRYKSKQRSLKRSRDWAEAVINDIESSLESIRNYKA
jgi:hypothetical protein